MYIHIYIYIYIHIYIYMNIHMYIYLLGGAHHVAAVGPLNPAVVNHLVDGLGLGVQGSGLRMQGLGVRI